MVGHSTASVAGRLGPALTDYFPLPGAEFRTGTVLHPGPLSETPVRRAFGAPMLITSHGPTESSDLFSARAASSGRMVSMYLRTSALARGNLLNLTRSRASVAVECNHNSRRTSLRRPGFSGKTGALLPGGPKAA